MDRNSGKPLHVAQRQHTRNDVAGPTSKSWDTWALLFLLALGLLGVTLKIIAASQREGSRVDLVLWEWVGTTDRRIVCSWGVFEIGWLFLYMVAVYRGKKWGWWYACVSTALQFSSFIAAYLVPPLNCDRPFFSDLPLNVHLFYLTCMGFPCLFQGYWVIKHARQLAWGK